MEICKKVIPKVIHYCWFGMAEKPQIVKDCIASWRKWCPDWEIIEWNESNFEFDKLPYMREAYDNKKWAFVSDVARLMILYENGGVYLDTDVELIEKIPQDWLYFNSFFFFEFETRINTGMGFGSIRHNPILQQLIDDYNGRRFVTENGKLILEACTWYNTKKIEKIFPKLLLNNQFQVIDQNAFLTTGMYNTLARHHYASSWTDSPKYQIQEKRKWKDTKLKRIMRNPVIQKWVREHTGRRIEKIYIFIAYDLLEAGPMYFFRRWSRKMVLRLKNKR